MNALTFVAERRFIRTPFGRTAYIERGSGPSALFLHGFPLSSFQWRGALDRLAPVRRCIAPDFERWLRPWLEDKTLARSKDGLGGMTYMDPLAGLTPLLRERRLPVRIAIAEEARALWEVAQ